MCPQSYESTVRIGTPFLDIMVFPEQYTKWVKGLCLDCCVHSILAYLSLSLSFT